MIQQMSEDLLWGQIVARAWCDGAFMKRLLSEPRNVLVEHGMEVPEGMEVRVSEGEEVRMVDDTDRVRHLTFPVSPPDELTDEDLVGAPVAVLSAVCAACAACGACAACRCGACGCRCRCGRCW
jgi:hypothetical protein